jgi:hypothetical protein
MQTFLFVCELDFLQTRLQIVVLDLVCLVDLGIAREYFPMAHKLLS